MSPGAADAERGSRDGQLVTALLTGLLAGAVLLGVALPADAGGTTTYYAEDFSDTSFGEEVYYEDFTTGTSGWTVHGKSGANHYSTILSRSLDQTESALRHRFVVLYNGGSGSKQIQRFERPQQPTPSGKYYVFVETTTKASPTDKTEQSAHWLEVDLSGTTRKVTLDDGTTRFTLRNRYDGEGLRLRHQVQWRATNDPDDQRVELVSKVDSVRVIRGVQSTGRTWEADTFTIFVDEGIDGPGLHGRAFHGTLNTSPAHRSDGPTTLEFDIRTSAASADWSASQLGRTLASGTVTAGRTRTVRQDVNLQDGDLTLEFDSDAEIVVDNVRVVGRSGEPTGDRPGAGLAPSANPLSGADAEDGRSWATNVGHGLFEVAFLTLQWGSLVALAAGAVLVGYSRNRSRTTRGQSLVAGGVVGIVLTLGFPMAMGTVGWLATGSSATAPLDDPGLDSPVVKYEAEFGAATLGDTGWTPTGNSADAFLTNESGDRTLRLASDGAGVEREITIERGEALPAARLRIDAAVESSVGTQPPDRDALNVTIRADGRTLVDDEALVTARGGDTTEETAGVRFALDTSTVTVRLEAVDMNGDDDSAAVSVADVEVQSVVTG
jgi:hypothetical protein